MDRQPPEVTVTLRDRLLRGTASNAAGQAVGLVTTFLLTPYILRHIGQSGFGLWALVGSVVAYGGLLDLGIGAAVVKFLAHHRSTGNTGGAKSPAA